MAHKYFCDLCGKEISGSFNKVAIAYNTLLKRSEYDCCDECTSKIKKYIKKVLEANNKEK